MTKKVLQVVTNDLVGDQRVNRASLTLHEEGYDVLLLGRKKKGSQDLLPRKYHTKRLQLWFEKGPFFYLEFNIRIFFYMLKSDFQYIHSNDLDTLLASFLYTRFKNKFLIYDSHEFFTGLPELENRNFVRKIWSNLEKYLLPKVQNFITVNSSLANLFEQTYGLKKPIVVRNLPIKKDNFIEQKKIEKPIIVLYQGAINKDRGIESMVKAMRFLPDFYQLYLIGEGDLSENIKKLIESENAQEKVKMFGMVAFEKLHEITIKAHMGLSLENPMHLNYKISSPNKIYDYIQAGLPVLASKVPETEKLKNEFSCIKLVESPILGRDLASEIKTICENPDLYKLMFENTLLASQILCWQNEKKILLDVYKNAV